MSKEKENSLLSYWPNWNKIDKNVFASLKIRRSCWDLEIKLINIMRPLLRTLKYKIRLRNLFFCEKKREIPGVSS